MRELNKNELSVINGGGPQEERDFSILQTILLHNRDIVNVLPINVALRLGSMYPGGDSGGVISL